MPRPVKKLCKTTSSISISKYFTAAPSNTQRQQQQQHTGQHSAGTQQQHSPARGKMKTRLMSQQQKLSSDEDSGLPATKRPKLSPHAEPPMDLDDGQPAATHSPNEPKPTQSRGAVSLCSSTLQKLRGFTWEAETSGKGAGGEACEQRVSVGTRVDVQKKQSPEATNTEEPLEADEDEEEDEEGSRPAPAKQDFFSQFAKSGSGEAGRGNKRKEAESSLLSKSSAPSRCSKSNYTPLEQQVMAVKEQHKDALLAVECGYKYRFFGEDAEIAAKELNIFCHLDHNFMTCSIPTHRLFVHVRRLVSHGHKVGVVKQTETSMMKSLGTNKSTLFTRQLTALYTKSTLVGEDVNPVSRLEDVQGGASGDVVPDTPDSFLLCISENWDKMKRQQLTVGLVAVQPSTGDVLLDSFPDGPSRSELESRLLKISPVEILVPSGLSEPTDRLLQSFTKASAQADDRVRVERRDPAQFEFSCAMNTVTEFYCHSEKKASKSLSSVVSMEAPVICCLGPLIHYLQEFNLERVLKNESSFQRLFCRSEALNLSATTLRNLEVLNNQIDGGVRGSLLWVLDHTRTRFGRRQMRKWVSQPLTDARLISDRLDAVQEMLESDSLPLTSTKSLMSHLPDLERGVCSIYHKKSSTQEFYIITSSLCHIGHELQALVPAIEAQIKSKLLRSLLLDVPKMLDPTRNFLKVLNKNAAQSGDKTELFSDLSGFPVLQERRAQIQSVLTEIQDHRREVRLTLKAPVFDYITVSGQEFLIQVKNSQASIVPHDWIKINSTKTVGRYRSPFLVEHYRRLQQLREQLRLDCQQEWIHFLDEFGEHYHAMKRAISHLATMDCLFSLAEVAKQGDYCRPVVCEDQHQILIRDGRHPSIDLLMGESNQYVPNHTELEGGGRRTMIITGPNMGGKSSYIRQVALICIMAHMGSYVPAREARLGALDGIYTRMGASDNILKGRSTFMEELSEASEIISQATECSLVILDELGRGTSTHDGIAIAYATLHYFIRDVKAQTLFVTHYPPLCELEQTYPEHVANYHMAFLLNDPDTDTDDAEVQPEFITFLYQLTEGAAGRSYGLNVARLADIPEPILHTAARKAREMENVVDTRRKNRKLLSALWSLSDKLSLMEWQQLQTENNT